MKETESVPPRYPLWLAYITPMTLFMVLTAAESSVPKAYYVWFYFAKVILVTTALVGLGQPLKDIRPKANLLLPAILVGIFVFVEWIALDKLIPYPHLGSRTSLNPFAAIEVPVLRSLFLAVRFYGLAVMVPVMEELFWRSFLLRYFSDSEFTRLRVGEFSWQSFWIVAFAFGLAHPEWLVAVLCACVYGLLLRQTKSIFACIIAHSTTNLALGIYVIMTHDWVYW